MPTRIVYSDDELTSPPKSFAHRLPPPAVPPCNAAPPSTARSAAPGYIEEAEQRASSIIAKGEAGRKSQVEETDLAEEPTVAHHGDCHRRRRHGYLAMSSRGNRIDRIESSFALQRPGGYLLEQRRRGDRPNREFLRPPSGWIRPPHTDGDLYQQRLRGDLSNRTFQWVLRGAGGSWGPRRRKSRGVQRRTE
ncbi:hypothetical protein ACP70R_034719 [Stipagrostis hirtigluma subsp. patula]